jgi:hypothetical protein
MLVSLVFWYNHLANFSGVNVFQIPTVNQQTGEGGKEPTLTLRTFRKGTILGIESMKNEVILPTCCALEGVGKYILSVM